MLQRLRNDAVEKIVEWQNLLKEIELCDENIVNLWMCLDFGKMYDLAREMNIVQGYLFNELYKDDFISQTCKAINSSILIENERKNLKELLNSTGAEYLDNLYGQVAYKLSRKNKAFSQELQQDFYKVLKVVSELNIEAIRRYLAKKDCVNS